MTQKNFTYKFETSKSPEEVYGMLLQIPQWWSGLYEETIKGKSEKVGDEFSFKAGGGVHHTEQKLVELEPNKKVVWLVTHASLTFASNTSEWEGTKFGFSLAPKDSRTLVTFTHEGLVPEIECYSQCSAGWTSYLQQLENRLKA